MLVAMVNIMCQLGWAMGPDIWLDIISECLGERFCMRCAFESVG